MVQDDRFESLENWGRFLIWWFCISVQKCEKAMFGVGWVF